MKNQYREQNVREGFSIANIVVVIVSIPTQISTLNTLLLIDLYARFMAIVEITSETGGGGLGGMLMMMMMVGWCGRTSEYEV